MVLWFWSIFHIITSHWFNPAVDLIILVILLALSPHSLPVLTVTTINKESDKVTSLYLCWYVKKKSCINVFIVSLFVSSGCRTLFRVSKLPGWRVLCGSLSQRCEGRPANCVEVQQRYRTLSALQHQLHTVVSGHTSHTHTSTHTARTVRRISHRALLCFSCTVMDERGCPVDTRTGWDTLCPVTIVSTFISRLNWTNSVLFEESELCWTVRLCSGRVQPSRLQWAAWCSSSSCWLCWSSTWGDRRSWRGRRQWGGSCKNTRWAQILMFYHLLEVKRKTWIRRVKICAECRSWFPFGVEFVMKESVVSFLLVCSWWSL